MASASPTADRIAPGDRDPSGETFERFTGGTATSATFALGWDLRRAPERRPRGAGHPQAEGHGHGP
jgi:hypothetical protein